MNQEEPKDTTNPNAGDPQQPAPPTRYRCQVCGYETQKPRNGRILGYNAPLICEDVCCDGPVNPVSQNEKANKGQKEEIQPV